MKKAFFLAIVFLLLAPYSGLTQSNYLYRQRVNWVKITKASSKLVPLGSLKHPYTGVSEEQMESMLLSIKLSKKYLIKNEVGSVDVFSSWEAHKLASYLVDGLKQVDGDHVVNFAVIHKRPLFILQNDHLSIADLWAAEDGLHFQFSKLFAKIEGDYEASANMDKAIRRAKTMRVALDAQAGQKLSYNGPMEIILDPGFNFSSSVARDVAKNKEEEEVLLKGKPEAPSAKPVAVAPVPADEPQDVADRLKKLDELKKKKLITDSEYQKLRGKILQEI